jgi:agmatinase
MLGNRDKIVCLGGDHSVSYPIVDTFSDVYSELNILHLDAHSDLYESYDKNPYSHASPFARIMETGKVKSLTQVGIRTLTTHQRAVADKYGVNIIEMKDLHMRFLKDLKSPLYLSLDIDVLDPAYAPGVSHHEPGGMTSREVLHIIQNIPVELVGADIVEYNPMRDVHNMTAMVAYKFLKEIIAKMLV